MYRRPRIRDRDPEQLVETRFHSSVFREAHSICLMLIRLRCVQRAHAYAAVVPIVVQVSIAVTGGYPTSSATSC